MARSQLACAALLTLLLAVPGTWGYAPSCRKPGARCAGAPGYPLVEWIPCCSDSYCTASIPGQWGLFCTGGSGYEAPAPSNEKCHSTGTRCSGAPGKPFVVYKPCCDKKDVCVDAPDWGRWCAPKESTTHSSGGYGEGKPTDNTCYNRDVRCAGAPGKPFVLYKPCCTDGDECVERPDLGWGRWCSGSTEEKVPVTSSAVVTTSNVIETTAPPVATESSGYGSQSTTAPYASVSPTTVSPDGYSTPVTAATLASSTSATSPTVSQQPTSTIAPTGTQQSTTSKPADTQQATTTTSPTVTQKSTMTTSPTETQQPTTTTGSTETQQPTTTTGLTETQQPTTTTIPIETQQPTTTAIPAETQQSTTGTTTLPASTIPATTILPTTTTTTSTSASTSTTSTTLSTSTVDPSGVCEGLNSVRPDITTMTDGQWADYVDAVNLLREKPGENGVSVLENYAQIHAQFGQHFGGYFAPWHRAMLWEFEKQLESVKPGVRIPTYDWSMVNLNAVETPTFSPARLGGSVGFEGENPQPIPNGPFQGLTTRASGELRSVLRDFDRTVFLQSRSTIDVAISTITTYSNFAVFLEGAHNAFHVQMGGSMNSLSFSPDEPTFYIHHAFVDKVWREWQQIGNGNKFGGTHPAEDENSPVDLDEVMQPFGRTVREILEGISGCVEYTDASGRSGFTFGVSTRQSDTDASGNEISANNAGIGGGAQDATGPKVAPKQVEAAGEQSAFIDSTEAPKEPKLASVEEKRQLQRAAAVEKVENPEEYRRKVLIENKAVSDSVEAAASLGASQQLQELLKKTLALIELKKAVDLTDVNEVFEESNEEIVEDGKAEVAAIDSNNEGALSESKRDIDGSSSDVSVAVETPSE